MKKYEVTGVIMYAHCFHIEVEAKSKKQAKELALLQKRNLIDPANAEFDTILYDEPVEIK